MEIITFIEREIKFFVPALGIFVSTVELATEKAYPDRTGHTVMIASDNKSINYKTDKDEGVVHPINNNLKDRGVYGYLLITPTTV